MGRSTRTAALLAGFVALFLAGCGDAGLNRGGSLTGEVTIDGKPVTAGTVLVVSENDKYAVSGFINEYGKYTVKEPPLGPCKIAVQTRDKKGSTRPADTGKGGKAGSGSAGMVLPDPEEIGLTYVPIPDHYEEAKTSGLVVEVKAGKQDHPLTLTWKK
jgi:hypothetical protein